MTLKEFLSLEKISIKKNQLTRINVALPYGNCRIAWSLTDFQKIQVKLKKSILIHCITVIPKSQAPPTQPGEVEQNSLIPQWAIAVIVIGAGSLLFVVIFGAAVVSLIKTPSLKIPFKI